MITVAYTASDSWTCPAGVKQIRLTMKGGGADGDGSNGGGGGARLRVNALTVAAGASYSFTVGGAGVDANWESGTLIAGGASGQTGGTVSGSADESASGGNGGLGTTCGETNFYGGGGAAASATTGNSGGDASCGEGDEGTNGTSENDGTAYGNGGLGNELGQGGIIEIEYEPPFLDFTVHPLGCFQNGDFEVEVSYKFGDDGSVDTSFTGDITLALTSNPGGSTITGTNPVSATAGVASFTLSLDQPGAGYYFSANTPDTTSASSFAFNIAQSLSMRVIVAEVRSLASITATIAPPPLGLIAQLVPPTIVAAAAMPLSPLTVEAQSVESLLQYAPVMMPPLQAILTQPAFGYSYDGTVDMKPLAVEAAPLREFLTGGSEHALSPLSTDIAFAGNLSFAVEMPPLVAYLNPLGMLATAAATSPLKPLQVQVRTVYGSLATDVQLSLQEISLEEFPVETTYDLELELELQEVEPELYPIQLRTLTASPDAKFAEAVRSSSSVVIFGSDTGEPFKLNPSASIYRRLGPAHIIHLGPAKPSFSTTEALFTLLTAFGELQPNEFYYEAPGGFLRIWNEITIQSSIIPDGDTAEIIISRATNPTSIPVPAITSLNAKRQF